MRLDADTVREATDIGAYIGQFVNLKRQGHDLVGLCPFHQEKSPSFVVHPQPDQRFFKCFGCGKGGDVLEFAQAYENLAFPDALARVAEFSGVSVTLGVPNRVQAKPAPTAAIPEEATVERKHVATYHYQAADGTELFEVWRYEPGRGGKKKDFSQCYRDHETGEMVWKRYPSPVLYRLPKVLGAPEVLLVEGEKDVHTVESMGLIGTTSPGGSNAPFDAGMVAALAGRTVFLVPDNDAPGEKRAAQIRSLLAGKAEVVLFRVATGKDITDWVEVAGAEAVLAALELARTDAARDRLKGLLSVEQILQRVDGGYEAFCDPSRRPKGIPTGFTRLDRLTRGMFAGNLIIIAGRPAMGKTSLAMNVAVNVAKGNSERDGVPVSVFSVEMSSEELLTRMVCSEQYISQQDFSMGYVSQEDRSKFSRGLGLLSGYPIKIDDQSGVSMKYIREATEASKPGLVIVDYLGLMGGPKAENRVQQVSAITRDMKIMAKDLRIPVVLVAQLNRSTETRPAGGNVPQLSDLRESGSIEQDADMVWFVYRPEYYKPDREDLRGVAEIIVAKQRNGPIGKVRLCWLGQFTKFENLTEDGVTI